MRAGDSHTTQPEPNEADIITRLPSARQSCLYIRPFHSSKMKILCLHGVGSSCEILGAQMASLRRELDPSFELVFVDGPFESERDQVRQYSDPFIPKLCPLIPSITGVPASQPGPFFSHTETYSPKHMAQAVSYLEGLLTDEKPFDGIFGFSQGAAIALSYCYQQQTASDTIAVKFSVLFSSVMPCSTDPTLGDAIISQLRDVEYDITNPSLDPLKSAS